MATGLVLKKAQRRKAFLKVGISAPAGAGKTAGSLLMAYGMMKKKHPSLSDAQLWEKVAIIDSENGSGELYVHADIGGTHIGEYLAITLEAPFTAEKYISAIEMCEQNNVEVIIIDSTTHLWSGEGGLLEKQNTIVAKSKSGNSYTAWREVTPDHNRFVEKMLQANAHVIATIRSKMEYVQEKDEQGNTRVKKIGLKPVQRDGMEYEFTLFLDIDENHRAVASKDRTSLLDGKLFTVTPKIGMDLMTWLESGTDNATTIIANTKSAGEVKSEIKSLVEANPSKKEDFTALFKKYDEQGNPNNLSVEQLVNLLDEMKKVKGE